MRKYRLCLLVILIAFSIQGCSKQQDVEDHSFVLAMGFERIVKKAIENFAKMGLKPGIFRTSHSVITRGRNSQIGFFNISGNKQYVYDHRDDIGLVMDKQ